MGGPRLVSRPLDRSGGLGHCSVAGPLHTVLPLTPRAERDPASQWAALGPGWRALQGPAWSAGQGGCPGSRPWGPGTEHCGTTAAGSRGGRHGIDRAGSSGQRGGCGRCRYRRGLRGSLNSDDGATCDTAPAQGGASEAAAGQEGASDLQIHPASLVLGRKSLKNQPFSSHVPHFLASSLSLFCFFSPDSHRKASGNESS